MAYTDPKDLLETRLCEVAKAFCENHLHSVQEEPSGALKRKATEQTDNDSSMDEGEREPECNETELENVGVSLIALELEFRVALKNTITAKVNAETERDIAELYPGEETCNAILVTGVAEKVPAEALYQMGRLLTHVRRLGIDLVKFAQSQDHCTETIAQDGKLRTICFPLESPLPFSHSGNPLSRVQPVTFIFEDAEREPVHGERKIPRQSYVAQAIYIPPENHVRVTVGIARGVRQEKGSRRTRSGSSLWTSGRGLPLLSMTMRLRYTLSSDETFDL